MRPCVLPPDVVSIVGRDQANVELPRDVDQAAIDLALSLNSLVLELKEVVARAEHVPVTGREGLGFGQVVGL